jgi:hypothetical protein
MKKKKIHKHDGCLCNNCHNRSFSEDFDAFYCTDKNIWLEPCCSDVECEYCSIRPEFPDMKQRDKFVKNSEKEAKKIFKTKHV